jgi:anti-anti-sigma regulatory factor
MRQVRPVQLQVQHTPDAVVVEVVQPKLLDECEQIGDQLAAIFEQAEQRQLLVDLRNVLHLSSLVLSRLISLKRDVHAQGGQLVLCNLAPPLTVRCQTSLSASEDPFED